MIGGPPRDTPDNDNAEIQSSYWRESRRNQNNRILEAFKGFQGKSVLRNRHSFSLNFEVVVLKGFKGFYFFLTFSLDKNNIGCPVSFVSLNPCPAFAFKH